MSNNESLKKLLKDLEQDTGQLPSNDSTRINQGTDSFKGRYSERIEEIRNKGILELLHILIHEKIPCKWVGHSTKPSKFNDTHFIETPFPSLSDFFRLQKLINESKKTYTYQGENHVFCLKPFNFKKLNQDQVLILPQKISKMHILSNFLNSYEKNTNLFKSNIMQKLKEIENFSGKDSYKDTKQTSPNNNLDTSSRLDDVFGD